MILVHILNKIDQRKCWLNIANLRAGINPAATFCRAPEAESRFLTPYTLYETTIKVSGVSVQVSGYSALTP